MILSIDSVLEFCHITFSICGVRKSNLFTSRFLENEYPTHFVCVCSCLFLCLENIRSYFVRNTYLPRLFAAYLDFFIELFFILSHINMLIISLEFIQIILLYFLSFLILLLELYLIAKILIIGLACVLCDSYLFFH